MLKKIITASFITLATLSCMKSDNGNADIRAGDTLPQFSAVMNNATAVTNLSFTDKVGLLAFFNTGCVDCVNELPNLEEVWRKYGNNIVFCTISREETETSVQKHWEKKGYTMPYSPQKDRTIYKRFASSGIPRVYVVKNCVVMKSWSDDRLPEFTELDNCIISCLSEQKFADGQL